MMKRHFTALSDRGVIRQVNQDSYYYDPEGRFFIVADGMGGHAGGEEASQIAAQKIQAYFEENWESDIPSRDLIEEAFVEANQGILVDQEEHPERGDMGTTAVVVIFRNNEAWRGHVGDSRLYRLRKDKLEQVTDDHTWVARALKMGDITQEQAKSHPWRHVLFQCLGRKDYHQAEIATLDVQTGDQLLLCSDGLTEEVPDPLINSVLTSDASCEETAATLIKEAKAAGGSDNITVIIVVQD
ncbi:MAG: Stp1/IreP family PP2C-type Ser/Thr phosphatase [Microcystaceae cyanobacterium]